MSPFDPFRGGGVAKRGQCPLFLPFFFTEERPKVKISKDKIEECKFILIHFLVGDVDMAVDSLEYRENRKSLKW